MTTTTAEIKVGTIVKDRDGFVGAVTAVTEHDGSIWYDVRFNRGEAVRWPRDLTVVAA